MITKFKIYESNSENELLDMGNGIYWYRNIFFHKYGGDFRQYGIVHYILDNQKAVVDYTFSRMLSKPRTIKNWQEHFSASYQDIFTNKLINKLIAILSKKKLMDQFCVIKYILLDIYESDINDVKISKKIHQLKT